MLSKFQVIQTKDLHNVYKYNNLNYIHVNITYECVKAHNHDLTNDFLSAEMGLRVNVSYLHKEREREKDNYRYCSIAFSASRGQCAPALAGSSI